MSRPEVRNLIWLLALVSCNLIGCAAHKQVSSKVSAKVSVTLPPECILRVEAVQKTHCEGPNLERMTCYGLQVTYRDGCPKIVVQNAK